MLELKKTTLEPERPAATTPDKSLQRLPPRAGGFANCKVHSEHIKAAVQAGVTGKLMLSDVFLRHVENGLRIAKIYNCEL